jgi:hypothetical protein
MKIKQTKSLPAIILLCAWISCSRPSPETPVQDTVAIVETVATLDSIIETTETAKPEVPIVISDSTANAINTLVNSKFEIIYTDSVNYHKVILLDYYDEYEGQAEMRESIWFFNKELSIVYGIYSYQNGAMEKPDVTEFAIRDNQIVHTKGISYSGYKEKTLTRWDVQSGGVILKWSDTFERMESIEPVPNDYIERNQVAWDVNWNTLTSTLKENEDYTSDDDIYTIYIEVPKPSELVDYKKIIIPEVIYNKLRTQ